MVKKPDNAIKATLHAFGGLPVPEGRKSGVARTADGASLRYSRWQALDHPSKGTVIILQGRSEHIEKYFEIIQELRQRGFGVLAFDWRGQGGSSRHTGDPRKGHVDHFDQYLIDLETILTQVALPDCRAPHYILAHSTGALVALLAAPALGNRIRRMVLCSPLIELANIPIPQSRLQKIAGLFSFLGMGRLYSDFTGRSKPNASFMGNKLTSDTTRFERSATFLEEHPDLALGPPTISWVFAACRAMTQISYPEHISAITVPTLLIAAGADQVVRSRAIERYGDQMRSGAFLTVFGAKHELLHEADPLREQALAAFFAFVPGTEVG